jgi:hypothetical protein
MKIAICFWGLCRSTNHTVGSLNTNVFEKLKQFNISYDIYVHTYTINKIYNNRWAKESNITLDNNLYKLLNPTKCIISDQEEIDKQLELLKYRRHPDPWNTGYDAVNNLIRALWSLYQVTSIWKNAETTYDYIMYIRPDVLVLDSLKAEYFSNIRDNEILLPNFAKHPVNDRFAIGRPKIMEIYGNRYLQLYDYSLSNKVHSETYLNYILKKNGIINREIKFRFCLIRANGSNFEPNVLHNFSNDKYK